MVRRRGDELHAGGRVTDLGDPRRDLGTGQVAALAGLGALGELDLQVGGVHQVIAGDAEAGGCDLLDAAVTQRILDAVVGFAALAGVGTRVDRVHGDGERLVRLLRDGAVAHCAGGEPLDDLGGRLDLGDVDRLAVVLELHESAQRHNAVRRVVDVVRVLLKHLVVAASGRLLQQENRLGVVQMILAGTAPLVFAAGFEVHVRGGGPLVRVGHAVANRHLLGQLVEPDATDLRDRAGEVLVDDVLAQADRLEQLRSAVAHDGGDTHLRHDLQHADGQRLGQVLHGCVLVDLQVAGAGQVLDGFERQIRVDACGTVCDQQRDMMDLTHIAGLDGHRDLRAGVLAQQVVLHGAGEQQ